MMKEKSRRLLDPPTDVERHETPISTHWMDENGILCAVSKKVERTIEHYQKVMEVYQQLIKKNEKLCLLADATDSMPVSKDVREYIANEMPKYIKAHAILLETPLTTSQTATFIKLNFLGFPVKVFSDVVEAKNWIKEFL